MLVLWRKAPLDGPLQAERLALPTEAVEWVRKYDRREPVEPAEFEILGDE